MVRWSHFPYIREEHETMLRMNLLNAFLPAGGRLILLTQGKFAIVDDADYEWLNQWKWCARWHMQTKSFYAVRNIPKQSLNMRMHRQILELGNGNHDKRQGDHINHDTLDNRRNNLRIVTSRGNNSNRRNQSPYGGLSILQPKRRLRTKRTRKNGI
jgi:hypothetical protein